MFVREPGKRIANTGVSAEVPCQKPVHRRPTRTGRDQPRSRSITIPYQGGHDHNALIRPFCLSPTTPRNTLVGSIWLPVPPLSLLTSPYPPLPRGTRGGFSSATLESLRPGYPNWTRSPSFSLRHVAAPVNRGVTPVQPCRRERRNPASKAQGVAVQVL